MLTYCVPLIPTAVFWWIMGVSDRYLVKWFVESDANGIYAVAYKCCGAAIGYGASDLGRS